MVTLKKLTPQDATDYQCSDDPLQMRLVHRILPVARVWVLAIEQGAIEFASGDIVGF